MFTTSTPINSKPPPAQPPPHTPRHGEFPRRPPHCDAHTKQRQKLAASSSIASPRPTGPFVQETLTPASRQSLAEAVLRERRPGHALGSSRPPRHTHPQRKGLAAKVSPKPRPSNPPFHPTLAEGAFRECGTRWPILLDGLTVTGTYRPQSVLIRFKIGPRWASRLIMWVRNSPKVRTPAAALSKKSLTASWRPTACPYARKIAP